MIRYTTPTITRTVEGIDLSGGQEVYVSIEQGNVELTKSGEDLTISYDSQKDVSTIELVLTQLESSTFRSNLPAFVQVNWISADGIRAATDIQKLEVMQNLLDEVIEYGN